MRKDKVNANDKMHMKQVNPKLKELFTGMFFWQKGNFSYTHSMCAVIHEGNFTLFKFV